MRKWATVLITTVFLMILGTTCMAETSSGTCGAESNILTWTLDEEGTLRISGNGEMENYNSSGPWEKNTVKAVYIEQGVTSIGDHALSNGELREVKTA